MYAYKDLLEDSILSLTDEEGNLGLYIEVYNEYTNSFDYFKIVEIDNENMIKQLKDIKKQFNKAFNCLIKELENDRQN